MDLFLLPSTFLKIAIDIGTVETISPGIVSFLLYSSGRRDPVGIPTMKLLSTITTEDRWVVGSIILGLSGIVPGALLAEPRAFGITALTVIGLLVIARSITRSPRLSSRRMGEHQPMWRIEPGPSRCRELFVPRRQSHPKGCWCSDSSPGWPVVGEA